MGDAENTFVEIEVLEFKKMVVHVDGQGEKSVCVQFAIRQPSRYPHVDIYVNYKQDIDPNSQHSLGGSPPQPKSIRATISREALGTLYVLRRRTSDSLCPTPEIGVFSYRQAWKQGNYVETESFDIEVYLIDEEFEKLQKWVLADRYLSMVTIFTPDIYYTYAGDYKILEWEASQMFENGAIAANAAIFGVVFHYELKALPVTVIDNEDEFFREARVANETDMRQTVMKISETVATIEADLRAIVSSIALLSARFFWIILLVMFIHDIATRLVDLH